ncbi:RNA polymerase sigma-70 factor (ECF subfamily) [Geodermatophilus bullaregiensis]|uniref:RNA polymerase subunit sigma-70 n=1 Tax=Geodermatophilus bullaregiensis TaxID=1564160 RepID=UPI00195EF884|nr:RNA polymerase subunit sigma-70 [Geodermatophilus bullaregiensis]MBM7805460.1 RNA polymerase sigma-70 factor (ECF subfamily) [Geodermatophilus bullaregiensis]
MTVDDDPDLAAARRGDEAAFARLVGRHRRELTAHCYRVLGSPQDAEDAVQEALLAAWRGLPGFEGRSSLRTWLYRVTTSVCLRQARRRPRLLSPDAGPPRSDVADLGEPVPGPVWLEPLPGDLVDDGDPATAYLRRESVELAYVAALQHLPATQRAVLLLREVLGYSAAEAADLLDTTPASVNSALQRARAGVGERVPPVSQQAELARLGDAGTAALVDRFVAAWERADVPALVDLLTEDVRFTMPPLPAWFSGRADVGRFLAERVFATPWRLTPAPVNASVGLLCEQFADGAWRPGSVNVLGLRDGRVAWIAGFVDPALHERFGTGSARDR